MSRLVAVDAERVQLRYDHPWDCLGEAVVHQEVVEVVLVGPRQPVLVVDELDDLLGESPELDGGAGRVGERVLLGEGTEGRQLPPGRSQVLEVL